MRPSATTALILAVGLVVAACGGDDATPEPDEPTEAPAAATATAEAPAPAETEAPAPEETETPAAEATEAPAEEPTEAAAEPTLEPEPEFAARAEIGSGDDPETTFALVGGMWKLAWTFEGCERLETVLTQVDGDFSSTKPSKSNQGTAIITGVPEGVYQLQQLEPTCTEWNLQLTFMG